MKVRFNDGREGIYPVEPERRGGVFLKLLEAKTFNAVTINPDFGCGEWPGGIDLCPDTMQTWNFLKPPLSAKPPSPKAQ